MVAADEALVASGEAPEVAGDSYLEVGPRVGGMALVLDWCWEVVTPAQRERWMAWGNQAVFNVWHPEEAVWGGTPRPWSGWSIDDPVNNYYFSFLRATMLLGLATYEESAEGAAHVAFFRDTKLGAQLVPAYAALAGGGSREGTGYGVAMMHLFRLYDLWEKSTGERIADLTPHARDSIAYLTHAIVPTLDRLAPIGDHARDSTAALFDYHRDYLLTLGALYPDLPETRASRTLLAASSVPEMSQGFMRFSDFLGDPTGLATEPLAVLHPTYHASGVGHVFLRSGWEAGATWAGFIAGPYDQSHAHHDQGSLLVYQAEWLAYDANIDSHSGIRQDEELHNLVRVESDGEVLRMREGSTPSTLLALQDEPAFTYLAADVTSVYGTEQSALLLDQREVVFVKPDLFVVRDRVQTASAAARRVFQLNTPLAPVVTGKRAKMTGSTGSLELWSLGAGELSVLDWAAMDDDVDGGFRLDITQEGSAAAVFVTVLSVGATVTAATLEGGKVTITRVDGAPVVVQLDSDAPGGSLTLGSRSIPLATAVEPLPLLAR
jgi:hypothetical protein